jgi:hypothetical protein
MESILNRSDFIPSARLKKTLWFSLKLGIILMETQGFPPDIWQLTSWPPWKRKGQWLGTRWVRTFHAKQMPSLRVLPLLDSVNMMSTSTVAGPIWPQWTLENTNLQFWTSPTREGPLFLLALHLERGVCVCVCVCVCVYVCVCVCVCVCVYCVYLHTFCYFQRILLTW